MDKKDSLVFSFRTAVKEHLFWYNFALFDVSKKYSRTILGPFWNSITSLVIILILTVVWSVIFKQSYKEFLPLMASGYIVWWHINQLVSGGCKVFTGENREIIMNSTISLISMSFRHVLSSIFLFIHNIAPILVVLYFIGFDFNFTFISLPIGVILISFIAIPTTIVLGMLCARYSDIDVLISNVMAVGILLSPVMWDLRVLGDYWPYAYMNPFTPFLEICKSGMRNEWPDPLNYEVILGLCIACWTIAGVTYQKYKYKLVYWL